MAQEMKFVAIINRALAKDLPLGRIFNAVGHMSAGLSAKLKESGVEVRYNNYEDGSGSVHPSIPNDPFIILGIKNSSQLATLRKSAESQGIQFTDFTNTMFEGGSEAQLARTKATESADLEYIGICIYGPKSLLDPITKKCSVFNPQMANPDAPTLEAFTALQAEKDAQAAKIEELLAQLAEFESDKTLADAVLDSAAKSVNPDEKPLAGDNANDSGDDS